MSILEILTALDIQGAIMWGVGILLVLSTLVEVSKIKLNPWSAVARWIGEKINAKVLAELSAVKAELKVTKETLDDHITIDDERNADMHRAYILRFNTELLRDMDHTEEDFNEALYNIDCYERYCKSHPSYQNNRAVLAIENIREVYKERLKKHDFLRVSSSPGKPRKEPAS